MYSFTGDAMYKEKAQEVADKLLPAFQTPTGIPNALVNIRTGVSIQFHNEQCSLNVNISFQSNKIELIKINNK